MAVLHDVVRRKEVSEAKHCSFKEILSNIWNAGKCARRRMSAAETISMSYSSWRNEDLNEWSFSI